jgi:hypothetical protein
MASLKAFQFHSEYSIERLTTWSRSISHPPYHHMTTILTENIINDLAEHVSKYSNEKSKPYPHYEYIIFFSKEVTRLLMDARNEMLISSDLIMGPPGLNKRVKDKVELAVQHLFVLRRMIHRQQEPRGNVRQKSGRRRRRTHVHGIAKMYQYIDAS